MRRALVVACAAWASACADPGLRTCSSARAEYLRLVSAGTLPTSAAFDPLLAQLDAVPANTPGSACARELTSAIRSARATTMQAPLAREKPRADAGDPCEPLAKSLGLAPEPERAAIREKIAACHRSAVDDCHGTGEH